MAFDGNHADILLYLRKVMRGPMAKTCGDGCHIICDFCAYYSDNGTRNGTAFEGEGICTFTNAETDACGGCDNYVCFRIQQREVAKDDGK